MRTRIPAVLLCLALALLPCAPGFASSITDADAALDQAQELLHWAYGLTPATLSLFRCEVEDSGDGTWYVTYTGELPYPEPLGNYTVALYPEVPPDVRWSHDADYLQAFSTCYLDAPVWGQAQLEKAYDAIVHPQPVVIEPLAWSPLDPASADGDIPGMSAEGETRCFPPIQPGPEDLPEEAALATAKAALAKEFGFTPEVFSLFEAHTSLLLNPDVRYWVVDFICERERLGWLGPIASKVGAYQVTVDAATGEVISTPRWSNDTLYQGVHYTAANWGELSGDGESQAVIPPHVLPWMAELYGALAALSDQDIAAAHTLLRASGFPRSRYDVATPRPGDVSQSLATFRAKGVLQQELKLSRELVDAATLWVHYSVARAGGPVWDCYYILEDDALYTEYTVLVDAATGRVIAGIAPKG